MFGPQLIQRIFNIRSSTFRNINSRNVSSKTKTSPLFILRQKTGIPYILCREALDKHNNNIEEAEAYLKAQSLAHGLQKATKVRTRNTSQGLVGLAIHDDNRMATVLELNCETDFVAKNQIFKELAIDLTQQIATIKNDCDIVSTIEHNFLRKLSLKETETKKLEDQIAPFITKLGENIRIHKATHYKLMIDNTYFFGQIHSQADNKITDKLELYTGRFGAIVALENLDEQNKDRSLKAFGNRLCKHIIGFSPSFIELPENIREHLEKIEEDRKSISESTTDEENYLNQEEQSNRDDWPSIMDQKIILSENQIVRDFCSENKISILYFNRFECGSD